MHHDDPDATVDWDVACLYNIYIYNDAPPVPQIDMLVTVGLLLMTSRGHPESYISKDQESAKESQRSGDITT